MMTAALRALARLLEQDRRYRLEAYQFVREALAYAHEVMKIPQQNLAEGMSESEARHLTGPQLCEAARQYAIDQYGLLSRIVLRNWGIHSTGDIGEIVFNLIRIKQMRKSDNDRREDFENVYDFETAFEPVFEVISEE